MNYEIIKQNFEKGLWSVALVLLAVKKGVITQEQADKIIETNEN